ncbi:hypothetical protein ACIPT9_10485 [Pectobacterium carotovorum]|uniref:hypothetical protein n=2 Tax=Pectobacterium TaxID=122277 RepID=UPI00381DA422
MSATFFYDALSAVSRMAENNGSDATFSCVLWQKMDSRKVCQSMMVWGIAVCQAGNTLHRSGYVINTGAG